jgi:hypothetical protein
VFILPYFRVPLSYYPKLSSQDLNIQEALKPSSPNMKVISTILSTILASLLFHGALSASLRGDSAENAAPLNSDIKALAETAGKYRDLLKDGSLFTGMYHKDRMMAAASCPYSFIKSATKNPTSAYSFCYFESEFSNSTGVECVTVTEGYDLIAFFVGSTSQNTGIGMGYYGLPIETLTGQIIYIPDGMGGPPSPSSNPSDLMGAATAALDKKPSNDFYFIASPVNVRISFRPYFKITCPYDS